jgi:predicted cobalt transporter CbtA
MTTLTRRQMGWVRATILGGIGLAVVLSTADRPELAVAGIVGLAVGAACFFGARQSRRWCSDAVAEDSRRRFLGTVLMGSAVVIGATAVGLGVTSLVHTGWHNGNGNDSGAGGSGDGGGGGGDDGGDGGGGDGGD